ncbi:MAG: prepilin-type N-terminal cleavage/methylation domain-containing protein [Candidatus Methylomirabilales bacterium]
MLKNKRGFTLIELVIIIILLGVLAAIAIPRYVDLRDQAIRASAQATLDAGRAAVQLDFADQVLNNPTGTYDAKIGDGTANGAFFVAGDVTDLEGELASSPNYPPTGAYGVSVPTTGFLWWLVTKGSAIPPVQPPVIDASIDTTCTAANAWTAQDNDCKVSRL